MKKGDKYIFKGGYMLCIILSTTQTRVKYRVVLGTFEYECTKKEFLEIWEEYSPENNKNTVD